MITVGKLGIVRRTGKDLDQLRDDCFDRDGGECVNCHRTLVRHPDSIFQPNAFHMSHIRNKRMYGDVIENVESRCPNCHLVEVHNRKSVPAKC